MASEKIRNERAAAEKIGVQELVKVGLTRKVETSLFPQLESRSECSSKVYTARGVATEPQPCVSYFKAAKDSRTTFEWAYAHDDEQNTMLLDEQGFYSVLKSWPHGIIF